MTNIRQILLLIALLLLTASILANAKTINVDGSPGDWITVSLPDNTGGLIDYEYVWVDAANDTRNDWVMISIDGSDADWVTDSYKYFQVIDTADNASGLGLDGANLTRMAVAWDEEYLYIAFWTSNKESWTTSYGIGIDYDGTASGYIYDPDNGDSWNRHIGFNGSAVDYEIYFYWDQSNGMGSDEFNEWNGAGWNHNTIDGVGGSYSYTGDTSIGLQFLELRVPWSAFSNAGGKPFNFSLIMWVAGGSSSSAVDSIPHDPAVEDSGGGEWTDWDNLTNLVNFTLKPRYSTYDVLVDLRELHITCNETHLFFLLRFTDLYYVGRDGAPGIMIALSFNGTTGSGESYLGYNSDTQVAQNGSANWEYQVLIDLANPAVSDGVVIHGDGSPVWSGGGPLDLVNTTWDDVSTPKSVFAVSTVNDTVEIGVAWSDLNISDPRGLSMNITVGIVRVNPSGDAWDISGVSDVLDAVTKTGPNTWDEVSDGYIDYYTPLSCSDQPEPVPEDKLFIIAGAVAGVVAFYLLARKF